VSPPHRNPKVDGQAVNLAAAEAALTGKSIEEIANAGQQRPSQREAEQTAVFQERKVSDRLRSVGYYIFGLLFLGGAATGIGAWFYHAHKVERREAEAATAKEEFAKSVVAGVLKTWKADDRWEDSLSSSRDRGRPLYSIEIEKAPIYGRPLIVYGRVEDVDESGESENSIVSIQTHTGLNLRLSLLSPPEITNAILARKGRPSEMFVFAVKINRVEKVASPPDSSAEDYFLGHGVLLEAEPLGLWRPPQQSAQSNQ